MSYNDRVESPRHIVQGSQSGLGVSLALVLGVIFFIALFGNGGGYNPDDTRELLKGEPQTPALMQEWRGNSAHTPISK